MLRVCVRTFVVRLQFSICKRTVNTYAQWHSFFRMICFFYCHYNSADVAVTLMSAAAVVVVEHCNAVQRHLRRTYACDDDLVVRRRRTSYSVFGMRRNASMCSRINSCVSHKLQQSSTREFTNVVDVTLGGWVGCSGAVEWLNGCTYHIISGIKYL